LNNLLKNNILKTNYVKKKKKEINFNNMIDNNKEK